MLTPDQVLRYREDGVVFPIPVLAGDEADRFHSLFHELERHAQAPQKYAAFTHLFFPWAYELASHPRVVAAAADILGPELLVDGTLLLCKHAFDGTFAPWHQDGHYSGWHMTPSLTAWIALTSSTQENGCLRVIPGSHTASLHAHRTIIDNKTLSDYSPEIEMEVDELRAVYVGLRAGEMSLHNNCIIHGSAPNRSGEERLGFVVRFVTPAFQARKPGFPLIRVLGDADCGCLKVLEAPPQGASDECFRRWRAACPVDMPRGGGSPRR
jgi:non-haem Fe2+, alpha-ketoglutarate-dependent halogenase